MLNKRLLLSVIFISMLSALCAQKYRQLYSFGRPNAGGVSMIFDGNDFIVSGIVTDSFARYTEALWARIDSAGQVKSFKPFGESGIDVNSYYSFIKDKKGDYLTTGYTFLPSGPAAFLLKFNAAGDTVFFRKYEDTTSLYFGNFGIIQHSDGNYYMTGNWAGVTNGCPSFLKVDSSGNLLLKKRFNTSWLEYGMSLIELPNHNILIGAFRSNNTIRQNYQLERSNTWLIEVDTGGQLIRQWLDNSDSSYYPNKMLLLQDSAFVYSAGYLGWWDSIPYVKYKGYFAKRDLNFNKIWELTWEQLSYTGNYPFDTTVNGDFIVAGESYEPGGIVCLITKISKNGQMIWQKEYALLDTFFYDCYAGDVKVLTNGDIVVWGELVALRPGVVFPGQQAWMLKVDSNGCLAPDCLTGWMEISRENQIVSKIQIQPNPGNGAVQLTVDNEMIGGLISLYNITGALVLQQTAEAEKTQLNLTAISTGMYIVTVQKQGQIARGRLVVE